MGMGQVRLAPRLVPEKRQPPLVRMFSHEVVP